MEYKHTFEIASGFLTLSDRVLLKKYGCEDSQRLVFLQAAPGVYNYKINVLRRDGQTDFFMGYVKTQGDLVLGDITSCISRECSADFSVLLAVCKAARRDGNAKPIVLMPICERGNLAVDIELSNHASTTHQKRLKLVQGAR